MTVDIDAFVNDYGPGGVDVHLVVLLPPGLNPGLMVLNRASDGILSWTQIQNSSPPSINVQSSSATNDQVIHGDNTGNDEASSSSATTSLTADPNTATPRPSSHSNSRRRSNPPADTPPVEDGYLSSSTETESPNQRGERLFQLREDLRNYLLYDRDPREAHADRIVDLIHEIDMSSGLELLSEGLDLRGFRRNRLAQDLRHFFSYDASSPVAFRHLEVLDELNRSPNLAHDIEVRNPEFEALNSTSPDHSPPHVPVHFDDPITTTVPNEVLFDAETNIGTSHSPSPLQVHFDDPITITMPNEVRFDTETNIGTSHRPNDDEPYINDIRSTSPRTSGPSYTVTNSTATTNTGATTHTSPPLPPFMSGALPDEHVPPSVLVPSHDPPASSLTSNTRGAGITFVWPMDPLSNFENTNTAQENGVVEVDWNDREHYDRGYWHPQGDDEALAAEGARNSTAREVSHDGVGEGGSGGVVSRQEARRRSMIATRRRRLQAYRTSLETMVEAASDEW
ncbi:MAG: hypothetical protein LQ350_006449 [Teloschistes chrysophthalmus]|nr:MAG: hypothetical protein LQ350_006449 [Niorma chrysophthalma]